MKCVLSLRAIFEQTPKCESPLPRSHQKKFRVFQNYGVLTRKPELFGFRQPNIRRSDWMGTSRDIYHK